jgi:TolA-binding protein
VRNRNVNISTSRQDSVTYKAAENKYLRGDCETAVKGFDTYIKQFPQGQFIAQAYFYKAECEYGMNKFADALSDYGMIINDYKTDFNETALRKSASILYNHQDYAKALNYYKQLLDMTSDATTILLANSGIMYTAYHLKNYNEALNAAKKVLATSSLENDVKSEAQLIVGRSAIELKDYATAKTYLNELAVSYTNDFAAEAAYLSCLIEFESGNYNACEKRILDMLSANYSSGADYWFASVFILYGDLYRAKGNYFQARHTYQSIVDNYAGEDLKNVALDKIAALDKLENKASENKSNENE